MSQIERRKADHIKVTLEGNVTPGHNNWDDVKLIHDSLPEVDLDAIDTSVTMFGRRLDFPLIVTAITGGFGPAEKINRNLAEACAELRIGMGVGSQRAALEKGEEASYQVMRDYDIPLRIGNVGAPQLVKQRGKSPFTKDEARKAMDMVQADVLAIHLNFLQEAAQPEGDVNAIGCLDAIRGLAREMPILIKETGAGISRETAMRLKGTGVAGLDVSGVSGTSFALVEMYRAKQISDSRCESIGKLFGDWGIPAPAAVLESKVGLPMVASGGMTNGLHLASAIVLGADCGGVARAVLKEATESAQAVKSRLLQIKEELKVAMFLTGSKDLRALARKDYVLMGPTREWMDQRRG
ncbi:MAG TPA: type 2 isopentenyl-diphosphate Delta-isomerase [Methanomassiliicoccales archaeon]|nr:type 2 isopentenyl-diphosphate Delta-isomerase [Methanomassiliicoccales archaeon]